MPIVFVTRFPNGRVYVGSDKTDSPFYFGSPSKAAERSISADFGVDGCPAVSREVLWRGSDLGEMYRVEYAEIRRLQAIDPRSVYNRNPPLP